MNDFAAATARDTGGAIPLESRSKNAFMLTQKRDGPLAPSLGRLTGPLSPKTKLVDVSAKLKQSAGHRPALALENAVVSDGCGKRRSREHEVARVDETCGADDGDEIAVVADEGIAVAGADGEVGVFVEVGNAVELN